MTRKPTTKENDLTVLWLVLLTLLIYGLRLLRLTITRR
jgi:hypothetical protein